MQSRSSRLHRGKVTGEIATAFPRLPRRFAPRNDNSGGVHRFNDSLSIPQVQCRERHAAPLQWHMRSAWCHKKMNEGHFWPSLFLQIRLDLVAQQVARDDAVLGREAVDKVRTVEQLGTGCLLYTSPSPRDRSLSRMPSSA